MSNLYALEVVGRSSDNTKMTLPDDWRFCKDPRKNAGPMLI